MLTFDDSNTFAQSDSDQMLFGPVDFDDYIVSSPTQPSHNGWNPFSDMDTDNKLNYDYTATSPLTDNFPCDISQSSPSNSSYYESVGSFGMSSMMRPSSPPDNTQFLSNWINDTEIPVGSPSSPIPIPSSIPQSSGFSAFGEQQQVAFPSQGMLSPTSYAALHPLPRSMSPTSPLSAGAYSPERPRVDSISPQDTSLSPPSWASNLWEPSGTIRPRPTGRMSENTVRPRAISYRGSVSTGHIFTSSSAPSHSAMPGMARSYSRRSESVSIAEDNDATIRRKKRSPPLEDDDMPPAVKSPRDSPLKSVLRPPKLAPSAWQLYFTDWIQKQQASGTRKLNVAQAAKEAGQEYALLTNEQKEPYKRKSQAMKEARERDLAAYLRTLTPDDIRRENAYRTQQRKEGKSRKSNIKDPNAPKKPLSAYFMFLQRIRANPHLVRDIFGDETETTKQSVLAAAKWRSMTDAERQPYLAQAEQEKMEYEAARRIYEEGHAGYSSSNINFSILPSSPLFQTLKMESESESEGSADDIPGRSRQ
jgi:hypothetical protein